MCSGGRNPLLRVLQNILRFSGCIPQSPPHVRETTQRIFSVKGLPLSPPTPLAGFHSLFAISFFLFLITFYFFPFSYFFSCTSMPSALSLHSQLNKWIILSERFPSFLRTSQNLLIYYIPYIFISLLLLSLFLIFHKDNSTIDRFYHNIKMFPMHCSVFFFSVL